jgi:hypothetical protein
MQKRERYSDTLLGQAGKIANAEAASEMGLFFKPKTGRSW